MKKAGLFTGAALIFAVFLGGCGVLTSNDDDDGLSGTIVFSSRVDDGKNQIFTMRPDGSELRQLTFSDFEYGPGDDGAGFNGFTPAWSPDGEQILFTSYYKATTLGPSLWVMNADGSEPRPLYDPQPDNIHAPPLPGNNPRWSPDGTKVAFDRCVSCQVSTNHVIFVFDLETEELVRLTDEPPGYSSMYPAWSPDGSKIAFSSNRDYVDADTMRFRRDLYMMDADGSNQTRLTKAGSLGSYIWMSTYKMILTLTDRNTLRKDILVLNIETREIKPLMEDLEVKSQLWIFWDPANQQLLTINKNHEDVPIILTLFDTDSNELRQQHTLDTVLLKYGAGFDWNTN